MHKTFGQNDFYSASKMIKNSLRRVIKLKTAQNVLNVDFFFHYVYSYTTYITVSAPVCVYVCMCTCMCDLKVLQFKFLFYTVVQGTLTVCYTSIIHIVSIYRNKCVCNEKKCEVLLTIFDKKKLSPLNNKLRRNVRTIDTRHRYFQRGKKVKNRIREI